MPKAGIAVEVGGVLVDLDEASWYQVAPCGCTSGATVAWSDYGGRQHVVATSEQAAKQFFESTAERVKHDRLGFTYEVGLRSDVVERMTDCPHKPKWGCEKPPTPEGMVWAVGGWRYGGGQTRTLHLIPEDQVEREEYAGDKGSSLCGRARHYRWTSDELAKDGKVECAACERAAS